MTQIARVIDVTQSYIPVDPNTFPVNLMEESRLETASNVKAVVAYDGHNILPTSYGYKSYFGTDYQLDVDALDVHCDFVLLFQTATFKNILVALAESGIWMKYADTAGAWYHAVIYEVSTDPANPFPYRPWSWCTLYNDLYVYRQGADAAWKIPFSETSFYDYRDSATWAANPAIADTAGGTIIPQTVGSIAVAYVKADGTISAASAWATFSPDPSDKVLAFTWDAHPDAVRYRLYKKIGADYFYCELPQGQERSVVLHTITTWQALASWPDYTWLPAGALALYSPQRITPGFLTMATQQGIFAAGMRLGFWDSEDSVAWSAMEDFTSFTPSLTTLAGSSIFADVKGRIVTIQAFSDGFIIYATQSITLIRKAVDSAFLWTPVRILERGIMYPRQVASNKTNDVHFVYTNAGIFKIENSSAELIIPEVWDLLKKHTAPVYLSLLDNRFLMFHIMDAAFESRVTRFSIESVDPTKWVISPGNGDTSWLDDPDEFPHLAPPVVCDVFKAGTGAQNGSGNAQPEEDDPEDPYWQAFYRSVYSTGQLPAAINWATGGTCPVLDANDVPLAWNPTNILIGNNNHHVTIDDDPGQPLFWQNNDKFVATQIALWKQMDQNRQALLDELNHKTYTGDKIQFHDIYTPAFGSKGITDGDPQSRPVTSGATYAGTCTLGYIPIAYSEPEWFVSDCGVRLRRYCIARAKVVVHSSMGQARKEIKRLPGAEGWLMAANNEYGPVWWDPVYENTPQSYTAIYNMFNAHGYNGVAWFLQWGGSPSYKRGFVGRYYPGDLLSWSPGDICYFTPGEVKVFQPVVHKMLVTEVEYGVFGIDEGYMEILGWKDAFSPAIKMAANSCAFPEPPPLDTVSPPSTHNIPIDPTTGNMCGNPYSPINIPGFGEIKWPEQSITVPGYRFLLQDGSVAPAYPTFYGAYVYDTFLKKWGRHNGLFKTYVDYTPVNGKVGEPLPYATFVVKGGILGVTGQLGLFNDTPASSKITYGKIGYYRAGQTYAESVRVQFASPSSGYVALEPSYNGVGAELSSTDSLAYTDALGVTLFANKSAHWYNVTVSGKFDLKHLDFSGLRAGRR